MKHILIVCDMFTTPAYLPRVRYFCKHLTANGYKVEILSEKPRTDVSIDYPCYFIEYPNNSRSHQWQWLWHTTLNAIGNHKCNIFFQKAWQLLKDKHYDAIICSTFYTFPLPAAAQLAEKWNIPFIADIRDMPEQAPLNTYLEHRLPHLLGLGNWLTRLYRNHNIQLRNKALTKAKAITTVSNWHKEQLSKINNHTYTIYNGYDSDLFKPQRQQTDKFIISYLGRVYDQRMQQPDWLMQALFELQQQGIITPNNCEVHWYSTPNSIAHIQNVANDYHVPQLMQYHTPVPPEEIPQILNETSIALVLSNSCTTSGTHGIMTTKVFEAIGNECPVLCVRSDEDCLEQIIKQTNIGIAARSLQECINFITLKFNEWQQTGSTTANVDKAQIATFARQNQTKLLVQLLENSI